MNKISTMIKRYRQLNDIEQRKLADEIGIKPSTLCRLESGKDASQETMIKLIVWLFSSPQPPEPDLPLLMPPETEN